MTANLNIGGKHSKLAVVVMKICDKLSCSRLPTTTTTTTPNGRLFSYFVLKIYAPNWMDSPDSSQHLMSVVGHRIKAAFEYPKYLPLSDQNLLKRHECEVNCECISYYVRRLNSL